MPDTSELTDNPQFQRPDPYDDEISLLDLAITLAKHKTHHRSAACCSHCYSGCDHVHAGHLYGYDDITAEGRG